MSATVILSDISVSFGQREILHAVSASFASGGISVLVGRSGSGKTTLLRAINRLNEEFPGCRTTGQVTVDVGFGPRYVYSPPPTQPSQRNAGPSAKDLIPLVELRQKVGMLFQTPNLFPVSVYNNLAMPLRLVAETPERHLPERVEHALKTVGLWEELKDRLNLSAEHLSGGQQQRLCLARLLALEPSVLLLDEPTASLDVHASQEIEELLQRLAGRYTIVMVSHSLQQARRMAERMLVFEQGAITHVIDARTAMSEQLIAELL